MRHKLILGMFAGLLTVSAAQTDSAIAQRRRTQQKRIARGVAAGSLTPRETARLERKEARLNHEIRRDRADGAGLTANEKARIERKQQVLSRDIHRQKND